MGGVGKTTIMMHIHNRLFEDATFDGVAFITVSKDFSIYKLQSDIWKALKFDIMQDKHEKKRAAMLSEHLERKKNCVLILDDVWQHFKLQDVGIPDRAGVKVVLTTPLSEVCSQMDCEEIKIKPLHEEEAWKLFREELGPKPPTDIQVEKVARKIAKRCAEHIQFRQMQLIECFIDEGFLDEVDTREEQYCRGLAVVDMLQNACLLEVDHGIVSMHALIGEMALNIVTTAYMVKAGQDLRRIPDGEYWTADLEKVSLMEKAVGHYVVFLILDELWNLRYLDLSGTGIERLLEGTLRRMVNLQYLKIAGKVKVKAEEVIQLKALERLESKFGNADDF
ncbi:probable disease resistance protein At1g61190 [Eucalyptus grandis]|uniref:probable disease resistance protein At1g61190 n=1 Tax=Eucalyptus grandis TaxID=71139 RepID=UPI00192ECECC|nr:probable disease resistance protein At1g61190 [Eucalyptus grandis]